MPAHNLRMKQPEAASSTPRPTSPDVVIAITGDDDRYAEVRQAAMDIAIEREASLILYDWDAATVLGAALPTEWSAEDTDRHGPERLDVVALEAAGRAEIGAQVGAATQRGIDASAWLPSSNGPDALLEYAQRQGASVIVVPAELHAKGGLERIAEGASDPSDKVRDKAVVDVVVIPALTQ